MNSRDPAWLNGVRESPSQAYAWHSVDHRQFCVLPSFENGNRGGPAVFAMWGKYGMGSRKYMPLNRWKRARKGPLES